MSKEESQPTVKLWSVQKGQLEDFVVMIEGNEIVCYREGEILKFPGGLNKEEFLKLVDKHNKANDGVKAITKEEIQAKQELDAANQSLLDSLK